MKKGSVFLCVIFLLFVVVVGADAALLNFDDITTEYDATVQEYGGFNWININVLHKDYFKDKFSINSGFENGVASGEYVAVNNYARTATVASEGAQFDFEGTYLTAAWNNGLNITVVAKLDGIEKYNQTVIVDADCKTWFDFDFSGINELMFSSSGGINAELGWKGQHFVMDDFTFTEFAQIPVPSTLLLFSSGLIGIAGFRRKFLKKA